MFYCNLEVNKVATKLNDELQTAFYLVEYPNGSNQDSRYNQAILFVAVELASSHLLQHAKFAWEAVPEAFCLRGQTT